MSFKTFNEVVTTWLHEYFEKYPEKRNAIMTVDSIDMMAHTISDLMCSVIGMFYVNRKYEFNLNECDLVKKRILRPMNDAGVINFLKEVEEERKGKDDDGIQFFGEFSEGIFE